jgi:hypothetical protein
VLILGAPNHMGSPSRTIKKFFKLAELDLRTKVAVFGTYSGRIRVTDRAVKKLEKKVEKTLPKVKLLLPSLSIIQEATLKSGRKITKPAVPVIIRLKKQPTLSFFQS